MFNSCTRSNPAWSISASSFVGKVEAGRGEQIPHGSTEHPGPDGFDGYFEHLGFVESIHAHQQVHQRREPGDRDREQPTARTQHAQRLTQRQHSIVPIGQVVERSQQQDDIERPIRMGQRTGIPHLRGDPRVGRLRLLDVQVDRIHEMHVMPSLGDPARVHTRPTTDIQDAKRSTTRKVVVQQLLSARQLQRPGRKPTN